MTGGARPSAVAPEPAHRAFLALGSNLGDRSANLDHAVRRLAAECRLVARSRSYETEAWGPIEQGPYLNAAVAVDTASNARSLLDLCLSIEDEMGRERTARYGPRTLDIDLLLFDRQVLDEPGLVVPHPRMRERRFVLEPLAEIAADVVDPVSGLTIAKLLERLDTGR